MIHSEHEFQRVQKLIAIIDEAIYLLDAPTGPNDIAWRESLRAAYHARVATVLPELHAYEVRRRSLSGMVQPIVRGNTGPPDKESARLGLAKAELQLDAIEQALELVREQVALLERRQPLNHAKLRDAREEVQLHEDLLGEWQAYHEELAQAAAPDI
jgi:hypothetical protein